MDKRPAFPRDFELILASQSPRRHSFLRDLDVPFRVAASDASELDAGESPQRIAETNALAKLQGAAIPDDALEGAFVLATDTIVTMDGRLMGKPAGEQDARAMLAALSGRTHQVVSGVALARVRRAVATAGGAGGRAAPGGGAMSLPAPRASRIAEADPGCAARAFSLSPIHSACAVTDVTFTALDQADIDAYLTLGEWKGKAGAYAIQGVAALFSPQIRGEYSNVVGLPLHLLACLFRRHGFDLMRRTWL